MVGAGRGGGPWILRVWSGNTGYLAFSGAGARRAGLSSGQSAFIVGAAWGVGDITSLAAGWLADRYGARRLVLIGGILCGVGFAALGLANSFWTIVLAYSVTASVGRGLGIFPTLMTVVNQWFDERKALALATINTAVTAGAAATLPALSLTGELIGWRMAAFVAGGLVFAITLPAAAVIRSRPEDLGLLPYGSETGGPRQRTGAVGRPPAAAAQRDKTTRSGRRLARCRSVRWRLGQSCGRCRRTCW